MTILAALLFLPALPLPVAAATTSDGFYVENFDSGSAPGWTLQGDWYVYFRCLSSSGQYSLQAYHGLCYQGHEAGSYKAISPPLRLSAAAGPIALKFKDWYRTHLCESTDCADLNVEVSVLEGVSWSPWSVIFTENEMEGRGTWHERSVDLSAYAGQYVRFRFHFQADEEGSGYPLNERGWLVDDIEVPIQAAATNVPPSAPLDVQAYPGGQPGEIHIMWMTPVENGGSPILDYAVHRRAPGQDWEILRQVDSTVMGIVDSDIDGAQSYEYRVTARNTVGTGPASNAASSQAKSFPGPRDEGVITRGPLIHTPSTTIDNGGKVTFIRLLTDHSEIRVYFSCLPPGTSYYWGWPALEDLLSVRFRYDERNERLLWSLDGTSLRTCFSSDETQDALGEPAVKVRFYWGSYTPFYGDILIVPHIPGASIQDAPSLPPSPLPGPLP